MEVSLNDHNEVVSGISPYDIRELVNGHSGSGPPPVSQSAPLLETIKPSDASLESDISALP